MADAVTNNTLFAGTRKRVVALTSISDSTGESAVVKVDKSALTGPNGNTPTKIGIEKIEYAIAGAGGMQVRLQWDTSTAQVIAVLEGAGYFDYTEAGGYWPTETDGTGDISLTTNGAAANDGYTITLFLRLKD